MVEIDAPPNTQLEPTRVMVGAIVRALRGSFATLGCSIPNSWDEKLSHISRAASELKERFLVSGMEAQSSATGALAARIKSEVATVAKLVKSAGIRAE